MTMTIVNIIIIALIITFLCFIILKKLKYNESDYKLDSTVDNVDVFMNHENKLDTYVDNLRNHKTDLWSNINNKDDLLMNDEPDKFEKHYKNKYFEFRDSINMDSNMDVDPVDKINTYAYSDFKQIEGKQIKDVYDEILERDVGKIKDINNSNLSKVSDSGNIHPKKYDGYHWIVDNNYYDEDDLISSKSAMVN